MSENIIVKLTGAAEDIAATVNREVVAPVKKATEMTMKDIRRDVPRMVGKRVAERYNIKATELQPPQHKVTVSKKTGEKKTVHRASAVKITGETLSTLSWTWEGQRLTVQRFNMKPAGFPNSKQKYDITFTVLRSRESKLEGEGRVYFINRIHGVRHGLSRKEGARKIDQIEKTTSIPAMIDNENIQPLIQRDINEKLEDRLNKNIAKYTR